MGNSTSKTIAIATLTAGSLDLLSAFVFSGINSVGPIRVMQSVAAGPFGEAMRSGGLAAAGIGMLVHFSIMTVMVSVFVLAAKRFDSISQHKLLSGIVYGLGLYLLMYWVVLPLRWPAAFPKTALWPVTNALFSHIVCVGIPMSFVTARMK
jgi:uncharacterized membrane protein YagU involved in acid resistance